MTVQGNRLTGDMSFLCNGPDFLVPSVKDLFADCLGEVACPCCNYCCDRDGVCTFQ